MRLSAVNKMEFNICSGRSPAQTIMAENNVTSPSEFNEMIDIPQIAMVHVVISGNQEQKVLVGVEWGDI